MDNAPRRLTLYPHGNYREWSSKQWDDWKADLAEDYVHVSVLAALLDHAMFEGEGAIPKANVRAVIDAELNQRRNSASSEGGPSPSVASSRKERDSDG